MLNMKDVFYQIDTKVVEQGFWNSSINVKKMLIEKEMKNYLIERLCEIKDYSHTEKFALNSCSLVELVEIYSLLIPKNEHQNTIRHLIHYILEIAGSIQEWGVTWWILDEEDLIECPRIDFDDNNNWDSLISNEETDYVHLFKFVYGVFQSKFKNKEFKRELVNKKTE